MYCMLSQSSPQSHSCLECDATNGLDYHFSGGDEDKAAQNLCPEVQGMLQVSTCTWLRGSSQGVRRLVMVCVSLCSYRITTKITEMFCPHCGYKTLIKVAMVVGGEEGSIHYQPLSQKQFSHRGLRVSCHSVVCKNWSSFYHVSSISTILILRLFVAPGISIFGYYLVNTGAAKACPQALANRACVWGYHLPCIV